MGCHAQKFFIIQSTRSVTYTVFGSVNLKDNIGTTLQMVRGESPSPVFNQHPALAAPRDRVLTAERLKKTLQNKALDSGD